LYSARRIWRTGAIGVAVAILGILFISNGGDWATAIDPSFVVYGQTVGNTAPYGGQTGGAGTILFGQQSAPAVVKVVPQIAVGSFDGGLTKYTTIVQVINTGSTPVAVSGNFYKEEPNGAPSTTFPFGFTGTVSALTNPVQSFSNVTIQPNASLVLTSSSSGPGSTGWGNITSTGSISVSTVFEFRNVATDGLYSRIGVASAPAGISKFAIARMRNVESVLDVGFALVNTGTADATITATLYDSNGVQVGRPKDMVIAGGGHIAKFVQQLFDLSAEPWGTSYSYVVLNSGSAQWAAMALAYEGGSINSFAVEQLQ
jgi:hypothetical protein